MHNFYDLSIITNYLKDYGDTYILCKHNSLKTGVILREQSRNSLSLKEMYKNKGKKLKVISVNELFGGDK